MSERTLKIVRAPRPCTCPKCAPKKQETMSLNALGRLKSLAALLAAVTAPTPKPTPIPKRAETEAEIAARLQALARQQLAEMGVPLPPDLNEAIRRGRK